MCDARYRVQRPDSGRVRAMTCGTGGKWSFSTKRLATRERIKHAMIELGPTRDVVVDCCVYGEPARRYVEILGLGLRTLVDHYRMP